MPSGGIGSAIQPILLEGPRGSMYLKVPPYLGVWDVTGVEVGFVAGAGAVTIGGPVVTADVAAGTTDAKEGTQY